MVLRLGLTMRGVLRRKIKNTPFDCGFVRIGEIQISYAIHYYILILVFIIFDLEVVFFLGIVWKGISVLFLLFIFLILVYFRYYVEYLLGALS